MNQNIAIVPGCPAPIVCTIFYPFPILCPALPGAFQAALHGVLTLNHLDEAVRATMRCGGCTSSRASFIGACFGAQV